MTTVTPTAKAIVCAVLCLAVARSGTADNTVVLEVAVAGEVEEPVPVRLQFEPRGALTLPAGAPAEPAPVEAGGSPGSGPGVEVSIEAPGSMEVQLPAGGLWRVLGEAAGYWVPETSVTTAGTERVLATLRLFPAGEVTGRIGSPPDGEGLPSALELRFTAAPGWSPGGLPLPGFVQCPVGEDRRWRCPVPEGRFGLRLKVAGHVPVYRWGVAVKAGTSYEVGGLRFETGASVTGWVEHAEDGRPLAGCPVELAVESSAQRPDTATIRRLQALSLRASSNERGFFQIRGVPPGVYVLSGSCPGLAVTRLAPVEVKEGMETQVLQSLALGPPVTLEIFLQPPLTPYGKPWRVQLEPLGVPLARTRALIEGEVGADGRWVHRGLNPGRYRLAVTDEEKSWWSHREVDLAPPGAFEVIELPVVPVRGTLRLGDEPSLGTLFLLGEEGERIRFEADLEGRFEGALPTEGTWGVEVHLDGEDRGSLHLDPVEVDRPDGEAFAEVDLRVPDTLIVGEVVDAEGQPVAGAQIFLGSDGLERGSVHWDRSTHDGEFQLRGVPEGNGVVWAEEAGRTSVLVPVLVDEDSAAPRLRLVLRASRFFQGKVTSRAGDPVPGAHLLIQPDFVGGRGAVIGQAFSGPNGGFRAEVPADSPAVTLVVAAPGYATRLLRVPSGVEGPLVITLERYGGTLVVEMGGKLGSGPAPLLAHQGAGLLLPLLVSLASPGPRAEAGRWTFENLEPGDYALCGGSTASAALREGQEPSAVGCSTGVLSAFGELVLSVP